jgi:hypothetical protein
LFNFVVARATPNMMVLPLLLPQNFPILTGICRSLWEQVGTGRTLYTGNTLPLSSWIL